MAKIRFFEKPGCINNARQKTLLEAAGHTVDARNLLAYHWKAAELRAFFGDRPIVEWFNLSAPRIKSGEMLPGQLDEGSALTLMSADPLFIRRPLMHSGERRMSGFDPVSVEPGSAWERRENGNTAQKTWKAVPDATRRPLARFPKKAGDMDFFRYDNAAFQVKPHHCMPAGLLIRQTHPSPTVRELCSGCPEKRAAPLCRNRRATLG